MTLKLRATPGVEQYAETAIESACDLADTAGPDAWSKTVADDALDAIDILAGVLSALGPDVAKALAPVRAATTDTRRLLGLADEESVVPAGGPGPGPARRARRRGLGPGFKGIRTDGDHQAPGHEGPIPSWTRKPPPAN
ncbi:hypothetical protein [Streptomyces ipomoeae]|uniref:hypothetical protein n=1 Tax=Streptomyces ipomoeae TaxID=103232 RepID=UPI0015F00AB2|nr:hypothetical protein [Streptomyces ipomoeae]MDX2939826.1 hypothetical protein [Streptomyces ipomoeae]